MVVGLVSPARQAYLKSNFGNFSMQDRQNMKSITLFSRDKHRRDQLEPSWSSINLSRSQNWWLFHNTLNTQLVQYGKPNIRGLYVYTADTLMHFVNYFKQKLLFLTTYSRSDKGWVFAGRCKFTKNYRSLVVGAVYKRWWICSHTAHCSSHWYYATVDKLLI